METNSLYRNKKLTKCIVVLIWLIASIMVSYFLTYKYMMPQNYSESIETYKSIAQELLNGKVEANKIPEDTNISFTEDDIKIENERYLYFVTINRSNDEIVINDEKGDLVRIVLTVIMFALVFIVGLFTIVFTTFSIINDIFARKSFNLLKRN